MSFQDRVVIEREFGPLWSGVDTITIGDRIFTLSTIQKAFDLAAADVVAIDLKSLPDGKFAFRFYDGDDRRVVVFVFDGELNILAEHRAHIAEWIGDEYYASGMKAYVPGEMIFMLRRKVRGS